ncbi:MAG: TetR/AcrR family transcriptional regulator [Myxococcota bacterium]
MPRVDTHQKRAMLEAAVRLFRRHGYERTSMLDVVRESGGPRGSLYHYFPGGKVDLARQAIELANAAVRDWIQAAGVASTSPADFVRRLGKAYAGALRGSDFSEGCPIATVALETAPGIPELGDTCAAGFDSWIQITREILQRHGLPESNAASTALHAVSAIEGALILSRARGNTEPLDRVVSLLADGLVTD